MRLCLRHLLKGLAGRCQAEPLCSRCGGLAVAGVGGGGLGNAKPEVLLAAAAVPTPRLSPHSPRLHRGVAATYWVLYRF